MPFTDNQHVLVFSSLNEHGIDRLVQLAMLQRPSVFNIGTQYVIDNIAGPKNLLCWQITADPAVTKAQNPLISVERPLPVLGTSGKYALDYAAQLTLTAVDFSPGGIINLPPPLAPQQPQRVSLEVQVRGGIGLPSDQALGAIHDVPLTPVIPDFSLDFGNQNQTVIHPEKLTCFTTTVYLVVGASLHDGKIQAVFDGIKFTGSLDPAIESIAETYARMVVQLVVLPRIAQLAPTHIVYSLPPIQDITLNLTYNISLTPVPASVPNNPAFEADQIKTFLDVAEVPHP
jgi:hypothetical protein